MATLTKPRTGKSHRLVARVSDDDKAVIAQAAALSGQTVSSFVLFQARKAALETFEAHNRILINASESRLFVEALLAPARSPSARMKRAMKLHEATVRSDI